MNNKIERFLKTNKQGIRYFNFDNLHDLSSFILENKLTRSECFRNVRKLDSLVESKKWTEFTKTEDFEEAVKLLKCGWESGAKKMKEKMEVKCQPQSTFRQEFNLVGGQASIPRYLQGIPTNMILNKRVQTEKIKIINVYKSIIFSYSISADEIIRSSIKAVEVVDALESQGYRVNLYVVCMMRERNESAAFKIRIKSSSERLNLKQMSFCLAHPSMLRRVILKLEELHPDLTAYGWTNGYGTPIYEERKYKETFDLQDNDIFIPSKITSIDEFIKKYDIKRR